MNKRNFKAFLAVLLTVVMVFSIVPLSVSAEETTATQVTDVADLKAGDQIVLVSKAGTKAMGAQSGTLRTEVAATATDGTVVVTSEMAIVTLEAGSADGSFAMNTDDGYIAYNGSSNQVHVETEVSAKSSWNITITDGVASIQNVNTPERYLQHNASSPRFVCYKTSSNQADPVIYKIDGSEGGETPAVPTEATISFADVANRTEFTTEIQVWEQNGITVTNDKGASTSNVADYANPARFYKSSDVTVAYPGMTKIVFTCNTNSYATSLQKSLGGVANITVTVSAKEVTVVPTAAVDTISVTLSDAQVRMDKITVYTGSTDGGETPAPDVPTVTFPFKDGDSFAIYYPAGGSVIGTLPSGAKLSAVEATLADGKITRESGMAEFTADFITDTVFCLIVDGKYLTSGATGNSLSLADEISDYAGWTLEEAANGWYIKNVNAVFNGGAQYIEFYSGFTTYGLNTSKADIYTFNFYALEGTVEEEEVVIYETPKEIVDAAYGLEDGQILSAGHKYTLTGVITSVDTPYDSGYKNVTVTIVVDGMTDKPIKVYRLAGEGADVIKVGDTITVTGVIKNYKDTIEFDQGCTLDSYTVATPDEPGTEENPNPPAPPATGDMIVVLVSVVLLAGATLAVVSRKRRFN